MSAALDFAWVPEEASAELRAWFEKAPLVIAQVQRSGKVTALSPATQQLLGVGRKSGRVQSFADLVAAPDRAEGELLLRELFDCKRESFKLNSCNAELRWTAWRVSGTNGEPDYALAITTEIPSNRENDLRLRQAEKLETVGRLAGGIAHDFNNLLTGVLLYCDLLMASLEPGNRVRKYAEEIRNAGLQATGLVRQLLAVARPTTSEPRLLSLNEIAEGMRNLLLRLIGENIELEFHLDPELGLVKMDPTQAQQVLLNLVLNARDAMPGGGHIAVETRNCKLQLFAESRSGGDGAAIPCALFVVSDNGSGMDAATRAHLFEAFFTTKAAKGNGLGLATVHDIVTRNGGLIHVDSAPACGTRVTVLLPLVPDLPTNSQMQDDLQQHSNEGVLPAKEEESTP
jgi:two-component system cell cycle sensor histidine kinase/response regulator CckA